MIVKVLHKYKQPDKSTNGRHDHGDRQNNPTAAQPQPAEFAPRFGICICCHTRRHVSDEKMLLFLKYQFFGTLKQTKKLI